MKKVIVFLADGSEEIEALTPVDMLRRAGADVTFAGAGKKECACSHGITVVTDKTAAECVNEEYDMVVLPGGMPGTLNLGADPDVKKITEKAFAAGKFVAAICAAPSVLGSWGMLEGKRATCYPGFEEYLQGAQVCQSAVAVDGKVITGCGMGAAMAFGGALIRVMKGAEKEAAICSAILADRI